MFTTTHNIPFAMANYEFEAFTLAQDNLNHLWIIGIDFDGDIIMTADDEYEHIIRIDDPNSVSDIASSIIDSGVSAFDKKYLTKVVADMLKNPDKYNDMRDKLEYYDMTNPIIFDTTNGDYYMIDIADMANGKRLYIAGAGIGCVSKSCKTHSKSISWALTDIAKSVNITPVSDIDSIADSMVID